MQDEDKPPVSRCFRVYDSSLPERGTQLVALLQGKLVRCETEEEKCSLLVVHRMTDSFSEKELPEVLLPEGLYVRYTSGHQEWETSTIADRTVVTVHYWDLVVRVRKLRKSESWEQVVNFLTASSIGSSTNVRDCLIVLAQGSILASAARPGKRSKNVADGLETMGARDGALAEMKDLGKFSRQVSDPGWWRPVLERASEGDDIAGSLAVELRRSNLDDYSVCEQLISAIQAGDSVDPDLAAGAYVELVRDAG